MRTYIIVLMLMIPAQAAFGREATEFKWWEMTTGVLAIPAAVIGLAYSFLLVKKTKLESRKIDLESQKLDLELREKRAQPAADETSRQLLQPVVEARLILLLLLRALVLFLVLQACGLIEGVYTFMTGGVFIAATKIFHLSMDNLWFILPFMFVQKLPRILYWVIFFAVGWPLFKDTNKVVGLNLRDFFSLRKPKSTK